MTDVKLCRNFRCDSDCDMKNECPRELAPQLTAYRALGTPDEISAKVSKVTEYEKQIAIIRESLNLADEQRYKCSNMAELAICNGLALGRIALTIKHDYSRAEADAAIGGGDEAM